MLQICGDPRFPAGERQSILQTLSEKKSWNREQFSSWLLVLSVLFDSLYRNVQRYLEQKRS